MSELKRCPFCGGEAVVRENAKISTVWIVGCEKCGADGGLRFDKHEAIKAWNTRYEPPYGGSVPAGNERIKKVK